MTDRVKGLVVTFDKDIRIDDVEPIIEAIRMIKGIASVQPSIAEVSDQINQQRIRNEYRHKVWTFYNDLFE